MARRRPDPPDESPIARLRRERDEERRREREAARETDERHERERRALEQFIEKFGDNADERALALGRLRGRRDKPSKAEADLLHALEVWDWVDRYERLRYEHESLPARLTGSSLPDPAPAPACPYPNWTSGVRMTREEELAGLAERYEALAAEHEGAFARLSAAGAIPPETGGLGWGYRGERGESAESEADDSRLSNAPPPRSESGVQSCPDGRRQSSDPDSFYEERERVHRRKREIGQRGLPGAESDFEAAFRDAGLDSHGSSAAEGMESGSGTRRHSPVRKTAAEELAEGARKGRPRGSGTFSNTLAFRRALGQAVMGLEARGQRPTEENVAQFWGNSPDITHPKCDDRQVRRWALEVFRYPSWEAAVEDARLSELTS